ncbi:MAG TPA: hypothetical protein VMY88_12245 [Acidimicrobiales bacterium]|nr:hypothetical protein [Acidimicrobiales bacterium]
MGNRWRSAAALAAATMVLLSVPSRAGTLSYADPADDATAVAETQAPRPSDPELDLLDVSWSTSADELVVTTSLTALGDPAASDGWAIGHYFTYEDLRFEVLVQSSGAATSTVFGPSGVYLRPAGDSTTEYPCVCRFTAHPDRPAVTAHIELHSIVSAVRASDPSLPRPAAGSHFTELETTSYRILGVLLSADHAIAPEGASLVV